MRFHSNSDFTNAPPYYFIRTLPVLFVIKTSFVYQFFYIIVFFNKNVVLDCILYYLDSLRNTTRCLASNFSFWWLRYVIDGDESQHIQSLQDLPCEIEFPLPTLRYRPALVTGIL